MRRVIHFDPYPVIHPRSRVSATRNKSVLMWAGQAGQADTHYHQFIILATRHVWALHSCPRLLRSMIDIWIIALQISLISKRVQSGMNWICQIYSDHCLDSPQPLFNSPAHLFRSQTWSPLLFSLMPCWDQWGILGPPRLQLPAKLSYPFMSSQT